MTEYYTKEITLDFVVKDKVNRCSSQAVTVSKVLKLPSVYKWPCGFRPSVLFFELLNLFKRELKINFLAFNKKACFPKIAFTLAKQLLAS